MAKITQQFDYTNTHFDPRTYDHAIQGKAIIADLRMNGVQYSNLYQVYHNDKDFHDEIKRRLVHILAEEIFKSNCIEFTSMKSIDTFQHCFKARIYAVPNDQVRILRTIGEIK